MRKSIFIVALVALMMSVSCGNRNQQTAQEQPKEQKLPELPSTDSSIYGLTCEGTNDSVLVLLPSDDSDPVTYNIIDATRKRQVIGNPTTGDWVCLMVNKDDSTKADIVVDLDQLKAKWVTKVMPERKEIMPAALADMERDASRKAEFDSLMQVLMRPVEIGFHLKRSHVAETLGMMALMKNDPNSPVVMPTPKFFSEWYIHDCMLVLREGFATMGKDSKAKPDPRKLTTDTLSFVFMTSDSLVLRSTDGTTRHYYKTK